MKYTQLLDLKTQRFPQTITVDSVLNFLLRKYTLKYQHLQFLK